MPCIHVFKKDYDRFYSTKCSEESFFVCNSEKGTYCLDD